MGRFNVWPADDGLPRGPTPTGLILQIIAGMPRVDTADSTHGDDARRNGSGPNAGTLWRMTSDVSAEPVLQLPYLDSLDRVSSEEN